MDKALATTVAVGMRNACMHFRGRILSETVGLLCVTVQAAVAEPARAFEDPGFTDA
jgi:hypothetical protein